MRIMETAVCRSRSTVTACACPGVNGASQTWRSSRVRLTWSKSLSGVRGSSSYSGSTLMEYGSADTWRRGSFGTTGRPRASKSSMPARPTKLVSPQVETQLSTSVLPRGSVGITTDCDSFGLKFTREEPSVGCQSTASSPHRPSRASRSSNSRMGTSSPRPWSSASKGSLGASPSAACASSCCGSGLLAPSAVPAALKKRRLCDERNFSSASSDFSSSSS
mmetsp:Transcript_75656/g.200705  ORF Transcript_75656/g.200705 Transcript_75656/m.200705 type:complete len:220 (-) Transcript_75656:107-766(-)